jgi:hypothetical protein
MTELQGETYLFNLSLLAITLAAVSSLVMLLRQTHGRQAVQLRCQPDHRLHLVWFMLALVALLPPLTALFALPSDSTAQRPPSQMATQLHLATPEHLTSIHGAPLGRIICALMPKL